MPAELSGSATHSAQRGVESAGAQRRFAAHCGIAPKLHLATQSRDATAATRVLRRRRVATTRGVGCDSAAAKPLSRRGFRAKKRSVNNIQA